MSRARGGPSGRLGCLGCLSLTLIGLIVSLAFLLAGQVYDTVQQAALAVGIPLPLELPYPGGHGSAQTFASGGEIPASPGRVNVLVLGWDRRSGDACPCQTDTMMLASLDTRTGSAGLVTIPRDLWVPIPGVGQQRINTAWAFGDSLKIPGGGGALAKQTVEANLKRRVDYYVLLNFDGFRQIVDTLGGVDIDVPYAIDDPTYPNDRTFGYIPLHFSAGMQHMDGERALEYVRTRHQDSDFGRSRRQIQVLLALRDKALRLDVIPKLPELFQTLWGTVQTDLTPQQAIALAQAAAQVRIENIHTASIDQTMTQESVTAGGADVLQPDWSKIDALVERIIPSGDPSTNSP